jgi:hypothetical protein
MRADSFFISPRVRGEVGLRAKRGSRVRGRRATALPNDPLTRLAAPLLATLSLHTGRRNKGNLA